MAGHISTLSKKAAIEQMAYYRYQRRLVGERYGLAFNGESQDDDYFKARQLHAWHGPVVPCYMPQIETAGEIIEAFQEGCRSALVEAVFQAGKTAVCLTAAEFVMRWWQSKGWFGHAIFIPMVGQRHMQDQVAQRLMQYGNYTPDLLNFMEVLRLNGTATVRHAISQWVKRATPENPLLIQLDECHVATAIGSLLEKTVLQHRNPNVYMIRASATSYEDKYSENQQSDTETFRVPLTDGYVGSCRLDGLDMPQWQGYRHRPVEIIDTLGENWAYMTGRQPDLTKLRKLLGYVHEEFGFENSVVKFPNIHTANEAVKIMRKAFDVPVVPHYANEHLNVPLQTKYNPEEDPCLAVVQCLKCSMTLPLNIRTAHDLASFGARSKGESTVASWTQELYGRMSGHGRLEARLVTAAGFRPYLDRYENGPDGENGEERPDAPAIHIRVSIGGGGKESTTEGCMWLPDTPKWRAYAEAFTHPASITFCFAPQAAFNDVQKTLLTWWKPGTARGARPPAFNERMGKTLGLLTDGQAKGIGQIRSFKETAHKYIAWDRIERYHHRGNVIHDQGTVYAVTVWRKKEKKHAANGSRVNVTKKNSVYSTYGSGLVA